MTLPDLVQQQVRRTPSAPAVVYEGEVLSYIELDRRANRLARLLLARGAGPERLVGVCVARSFELVVALCALYKAGAAYLPIDVNQPAERIAYQLSDAAPAIVVTTSAATSSLPPCTGITTVILDDKTTRSEIDSLPGDVAVTEYEALHPMNAAYVIYTSGSTGRPKGVVTPHEGIVNRLRWMQSVYRLTAEDRVLQKTPVAFDVSVWELLWPLTVGATITLARPGGHQDPRYLAELIRERGVTVAHFVPSMLALLLEEPAARACAQLRLVICSGERLTAELRDRFHRLLRARLENLYGPTEASIDVTYWSCSPSDAGEPVVPIGHPVWNTQVHVLSPALTPVESGAVGELMLGGVQLARCYLGRPRLTAERFVPDPLGPPGSRLYRAGDLGRVRPDGALEFLGRADDQLKIRGIRVEPGEIESVIEAHPGVSRVAVAAGPDRSGALTLFAYVVPDPELAKPVRNMAGLGAQNVPLHRVDANMMMFSHSLPEAEFLYNEVFERREYSGHGLTLPDDAVVFDVGAHVGFFSVFIFYECANPRIYAFEPIPELFEVLRLNIAVHGVTAKLFNYGLADQAGSGTFAYYPNMSIMSGRYADEDADRAVLEAYLRNEQSTNGIAASDLQALLRQRLYAQQVTCELRTISDVIDEQQIARLDLLKLDAEKSELEILRGVRAEHWRLIRQVVAEVHDIDSRVTAVTELLTANGFTVTTHAAQPLASTGLVNLFARRVTDADVASTPRVRRPQWGIPDALRRDIRDYAARRLPEYLVPSAVVFLPDLPRTPNGKLDRGALSELGPLEFRAERQGRPPRTVREIVLSELFASALGVAEVGLDQSLFELGGHSLLAARIVPRIRGVLGDQVTVADVLTEPTVAGLITRVGEADGGGAYEPVLALRATGTGTPIWCVHSSGGLGWAYAALLPRLNADCPIYALQAPYLLNNGVAEQSAAELAATHTSRLRAIQSSGPYRVVGWSAGIAIVDHMVALLRAAGEECTVLAVLEQPGGQSDLDVIRSVLAGNEARHSAVARALLAEANRIAL